MTYWRLVFSLVLALTGVSLLAQQPAVETAKSEAIRLYPELGKPGSPTHQRFVKAFDEAKKSNDPVLQNSDWPLVIAKRIAEDKNRKEIQRPIANPGRGLGKLVKLSVDEVSASPFSLEGVLVELTGIRKVEVQEIEEGIYEVKIRSKDLNTLVAVLPRDQAAMAERSMSLFVSVDKPDRSRTTVVVHGNKTIYQGLSTMPTVVWQ